MYVVMLTKERASMVLFVKDHDKAREVYEKYRRALVPGDELILNYVIRSEAVSKDATKSAGGRGT